jgi:hypothetical protein
MKLEGTQIAMEPLASDYRGPFPVANVGKDGTFEFKTVLPGAFRINGIAQGYVKSMTMGGREIAPEHFEIPAEGAGQMHITLGSKMGTVQISVDPAPKEGEFITVALVPAGGGQPFMSYMQSGGQGTSGIGMTVPPGKYRALATSGQNYNLANLPGVMKILESRSVPVEVEEGGQVKVTASVVPPDDFQKAMENAEGDQ